MDTHRLTNGLLTVTTCALGAELTSVLDENGVERIWSGPQWASHAPILFPIAGALREDTYYVDGKAHKLGKHGFARPSAFLLESRTEDEITYLLTPATAVEADYPFDYEFRVRYALRGHAIVVDYEVTNVGAGEMFYSVGAHEGYACPEGISQYELVFDRPETLRANLLDGSLIRHESVTVLENGTVFPLRDEDYANDALVFLDVASRGVTLRSKLHARTVRVDFAGFDVLLLWMKPGAGFICIEPWCNAPDYVDSDQDFSKKPGVIRLAPGERRVKTHALTFK